MYFTELMACKYDFREMKWHLRLEISLYTKALTFGMLSLNAELLNGASKLN